MMHRVNRIVVATLATAVLLAGCGGSGKDEDSESGDAVGTSTTVASLINPDGTPATTGSGTGSGSGTGGSGSGSGGGAGKGPERNDIPLAGRYTYDYTPQGESARERLLDVHDGGERRGDVRQGMFFGSGTTVTATQVVWLGTDSYYVEIEQRAQGSNQGSRCIWKPGFVELDLPLQNGKTWKSDSTCTSDGGTRRRTMDAKVTGTETITIGGQPVKVWVIQRTVDTHTEATGSAVKLVSDERRVTTDRFSVERHLLVRSEGTETSTLNGAPRDSLTFSLVLRALTPAPVPKG